VICWSPGEMGYYISSYTHFPQFLSPNIEDMIQARDHESSVPWTMDCSLDLLVRVKTLSFFKKTYVGHMHLISNKGQLIVLSFIQLKDGYELIKTAISALYQFRALTNINTIC
jgi:hypothetical protein